MKWTDQQREAIEKQGSDILVSAAAGSGKTAVLTERIKQLILQRGIPIEKMLIVTFSNAAAAEMKEKIIKALMKAEADCKSGGMKGISADFAGRQVRRARTADISTFHKFSMNVIRRHFYLTDIEPDFGICDEGRRQLLIAETLDELLEERFESGGEQFTEFLRKYSRVRNENDVREMILSVYRFIMSMPEPFKWLDEAIEALNCDEGSFRQHNVYKALREDIRKDAEYACRMCGLVYDEVCRMPSLEPKAKQDLESVEHIKEALEKGSDDELAKALAMKFETFRAGKDDKADYEQVKDMVRYQRDRAKDTIKKIVGEISVVSLQEEVDRINATYEPAIYLAGLVKDFHHRFAEKKAERSLLDFNDIEHAALEILGHQEIAEEYRRRFDVIFIDEYQDSSIIQETLISRISRGNNVYMVGDVKQSIYKFRLAEPEIFIDKYNDFREGRRPGVRIDLNSNFRSKGSIIKGINAVFENVMNRDTCGIDYDDDASLKKGSSYEGELDRRVSLHLVDGHVDEDMSDIDEEIADLKNMELEARIAARLAVERIGQEIYDQKLDRVRKVEPGDVVILLRSTRSKSDIYANALKEAGLPAFIDAGEGYFETTEIEVFMNLLKIIDNKRKDVPLLSVLRSPIFGFSIDELIKIRLAYRECSYNEAFLKYAGLGSGREKGSEECDGTGSGQTGEDGGMHAENTGGPNGARVEAANGYSGLYEEQIKLREKCIQVCIKLDRWRREARHMPLENFLWHLIQETGYMEYVSALPGGDVRGANLRALVDKAVDFTASHMKGLFGFISYAEAVSKNKVPIGQAMQAGNAEKMVRIMTIHKSKGLEFPVVILSGLGSRFNRDRNTSRVILHKDLGIGLQFSDWESKAHSSTVIQRVIAKQRDRERIAEEMRILYVAMTRAMDELVMSGSLNNLETQMEKYEMGVKGSPEDAGCFLDWIVPYADKGEIDIHFYDRLSLSADIREMEKKSSDLEDEIKTGFPSFVDSQGLMQEIGRRFEFEYGYGDDVFSKSKFSVSELNRVLKGETVYSPRTELLKGGQALEDSVYDNIPEEDYGKPEKCIDEEFIAEEFIAEEFITKECITKDNFTYEKVLREELSADWDDRLDRDLDEVPYKISSYKMSDEILREISEKSGVLKEMSEEKQYPAPMFLKGEVGITAAMRGTLTHRTMELIPFEEGMNEERIEAYLKEFTEKGLMMEKEADAVNSRKIASFFNSEMGKRACRAQWLKKEWAFTLKKKREEVAALAESREISEELLRELPPELMIQGIIDCCFKDEQGIVIIDFKTDYVDLKNREAAFEKLRRQYKRQVMLYAEVVEKALDEKVSDKVLFLLDSGDILKI